MAHSHKLAQLPAHVHTHVHTASIIHPLLVGYCCTIEASLLTHIDRHTVTGTFVIVAGPPRVRPDCKCPASHPIISDDEHSCFDDKKTSMVSRLGFDASLPGFALDGSYNAWRVTGWDVSLAVELQIKSEVESIEIHLGSRGAIPSAVLLMGGSTEDQAERKDAPLHLFAQDCSSDEVGARFLRSKVPTGLLSQ